MLWTSGMWNGIFVVADESNKEYVFLHSTRIIWIRYWIKRWVLFELHSFWWNYDFELAEPYTLLQIDGKFTLDENIADNGGATIAYGAYQKYVELNGAEPVLPGLDFTANQLFWITSARFLCSVTRPEFERFHSQINSHTPNEYRVVGALSNSREFLHDFNCKQGSAMNPANKCKIWWIVRKHIERQNQEQLEKINLNLFNSWN